MNCREFRLIVGAEPRAETPDLRAHAGECAACKQYRHELQQMDRLIHRALAIEIEVPKVAASTSRVRTHWRLAASLLIAAVLATALWLARPRASFAGQVAAHARGEVGALVRTSDRLEPADVAAVLGRSGVQMRPAAMHVSYAKSCWFRGHYVPHLVVQTAWGPVTVLVLRDQGALPRSELRSFTEGGFSGVIVPAPEGVLAVLSQGHAVEQAANETLRALDYSGADD